MPPWPRWRPCPSILFLLLASGKPTGVIPRHSRDTAHAVLHRPSHPLAPLVRLEHRATRPLPVSSRQLRLAPRALPPLLLPPTLSSVLRTASKSPCTVPRSRSPRVNKRGSSSSRCSAHGTVQGCCWAPNWSRSCTISRTSLFSSSACLALDSNDRRRLRGWAAGSRSISGKPDVCKFKARGLAAWPAHSVPPSWPSRLQRARYGE